MKPIDILQGTTTTTTTNCPTTDDNDDDCDDFCCPICLDSFTTTSSSSSSSSGALVTVNYPGCASFKCGHNLCHGCLTDFLTYRIVRENEAFPTCHLAFCDRVASTRLLAQHLLHTPDILRLVSQRQDDRRARTPDGRPIICPYNTNNNNSPCRHQPLPPPALSKTGDAAFITHCPECEQEVCVRCGAPAHHGEQCKRVFPRANNNNNTNSSRSFLFRVIGRENYYQYRYIYSGNTPFWGHFAACSRCLAVSHMVNNEGDAIVTCCGEEVLVLREQADLYRYCRKLAWRLFLLTLLRSDFVLRWFIIHALNLWIAFSIVTLRRPLLFLFSFTFCPLFIAKLYHLCRAFFTLCSNYFLVHCYYPSPDPASSSSSDSLGAV